MAELRPRVWVSQPLFDDIVGRLAAHFDVQATAGVTEHSPEAIADALRDSVGALVTLNERIGPREIAGAERLRAIANVGVGYNNLDIAALTQAGIVATNTPDVLTETTADFGFALLMATARRITEAERWLREGQWQQWSFGTLLGADLHGSTLGIVGMGRIGQGIARRARGFGMRVLYHNRSRLPELVERECGATYAGFDDLLVQADHVILVLPYSAQVHHLVDAAALAMCGVSTTLRRASSSGRTAGSPSYTSRPAAARRPWRPRPLPASPDVTSITDRPRRSSWRATSRSLSARSMPSRLTPSLFSAW